MNAYLYEFFGTAVMILLGSGVVANVCLKKTKGNGGGWTLISLAWGFAVFVGAYIAQPSGAHLNPAVTLGLTFAGVFEASVTTVIGYIVAQILGAMLGALLTYLMYKKHFDEDDDPAIKLGVFATTPAIRSYGWNFVGEFIASYLLVIGILFAPQSMIAGALPVAMLVMVIGMSLGGVTGYAINPARDLGPRIMHFLLPIRGKGTSDWAYAWIPILAPIVAAVLAGLTYSCIKA